MKIGLIIDSVISGPISVGNYTKALIKELQKEDIELILLRLRKDKNTNQTLDLDILHIPDLAGASAPNIRYLTIKSFKKLVLTLHGVAPLVLSPEIYYGRKLKIRFGDYNNILKWKTYGNKFSSMIITVSNSERKNIVEKLKIPEEKIKVIYHGIDHKIFKRLYDEKIYEKYKINTDFLLHVSSYQPKKNVEGIIKAFKLLKDEYDISNIELVIVGKQPKNLKILAKALEIDVLFLGYVPYEDLPKLYSAAMAFIFPSFHESFGMPILEAMACGCPVITSNIFSMPEISGNSAMFVNPYDTNEIANAMYNILIDDKLRKKLRRKGLRRVKNFSWKKCAKEHLKVYTEIIS